MECSKSKSHLCIYVLADDANETNCGPNRWRFLIECLQDLDTKLKSLGSRLIVLRGDPVVIATKILSTGIP
jgi:cryptochrome